MRAESSDSVRVDGREVAITHAGKVLFPDYNITKGDLIRYYQQVGRLMVPYLAGRPLAFQRFPDGIGGSGFFQKAAASYYPAWMRTATVPKAGGTVKHVVCDDVATLVYLANQACITLHSWLSRADRLECPDQMVFDFDPSAADFSAVVAGARLVKEILDDLDLPAYAKATGSRGLHVVVPLDRKQDFETVRAFARQLAEIVVARDPDRYTLEQYKSRRGGRVFVDINRNAYAQTAVAVYSVRARRGGTVSVPLGWKDLDGRDFRPDGMTMQMVLERLDSIEGPWKGFWRDAASLDKARSRLVRMRGSDFRRGNSSR